MQSETFEIEGSKRRRPAIPRKWLISRLFELFFCAKSVKNLLMSPRVWAALCRFVPLGTKSGTGRRNSLSGLKAPS
jgi:hypothetical protein